MASARLLHVLCLIVALNIPVEVDGPPAHKDVVHCCPLMDNQACYKNKNLHIKGKIDPLIMSHFLVSSNSHRLASGNIQNQVLSFLFLFFPSTCMLLNCLLLPQFMVYSISKKHLYPIPGQNWFLWVTAEKGLCSNSNQCWTRPLVHRLRRNLREKYSLGASLVPKITLKTYKALFQICETLPLIVKTEKH